MFIEEKRDLTLSIKSKNVSPKEKGTQIISQSKRWRFKLTFSWRWGICSGRSVKITNFAPIIAEVIPAIPHPAPSSYKPKNSRKEELINQK